MPWAKSTHRGKSLRWLRSQEESPSWQGGMAVVRAGTSHLDHTQEAEGDQNMG